MGGGGGKQSASGSRLDINDRPTRLYKAVSVQLWYAPSASGPQIFIYFILFFFRNVFSMCACVCLVRLLSLK